MTLVIIILIIVGILVIPNIKIVPQAKRYVIERLEKGVIISWLNCKIKTKGK